MPVLDPGRHGQGPVQGAGERQGSQKVLGLVTEAACERWGSGGDRTGDGSGTDRGMQRGTERGPRRGMKRGLQHRGSHRGV